MTVGGGGGRISTSGGGGGFSLKFFTAQHLHQHKSMDLSKFLLCFLILFNVPFSEKGKQFIKIKYVKHTMHAFLSLSVIMQKKK